MAKRKGDRSPESQSAKVLELRLASALRSAKALEGLAEAKAEPLPKAPKAPIEAGRPVKLVDFLPMANLGWQFLLHSASDRTREERRRSRKAESDSKRRTEAETRRDLARQLYANLSSDHRARGAMHCYREVAKQMSEILTERKRRGEIALGGEPTGRPVKVSPVTVRKVYLPPAERGNG